MSYMCKLCKKVFPSRKKVREHVRKDHGVKSDKPYGDKKTRNSPISESYVRL